MNKWANQWNNFVPSRPPLIWRQLVEWLIGECWPPTTTTCLQPIKILEPRYLPLIGQSRKIKHSHWLMAIDWGVPLQQRLPSSSDIGHIHETQDQDPKICWFKSDWSFVESLKSIYISYHFWLLFLQKYSNCQRLIGRKVWLLHSGVAASSGLAQLSGWEAHLYLVVNTPLAPTFLHPTDFCHLLSSKIAQKSSFVRSCSRFFPNYLVEGPDPLILDPSSRPL